MQGTLTKLFCMVDETASVGIPGPENDMHNFAVLFLIGIYTDAPGMSEMK